MNTDDPTKRYEPAPSTNVDLRQMLLEVVREVIAQEVTPRLDRLEKGLTEVQSELKKLNRKLDLMGRDVYDARAEVAELTDRVEALESTRRS